MPAAAGAAASPTRSFTYVAEGIGSTSVQHAAEELGGTVHAVDGSACVVVDRVWDATDWHGRRPVSSLVPDPLAPISLFDGRLEAAAGWAERIVYFDLETTGLSGGAGTLAFLAGCGWFENEGFRVRQFLLAGPAGEHAMLDALAKTFGEASLLVTFNGRTFDLPLMETRWAFHRQSNPAEDLAHFDMLPPSRRLWSRREGDRRGPVDGGEDGGESAASCTLTSLERAVLGFHRLGDVPGLEIPTRYFHFLRTGDAGPLEGVLDHNRYDLLSLAAIMSRALALASDGPEHCREGSERLGLGRLYERAGDSARAGLAYELASDDDDREVCRIALARLAELRRREGRHEDAAAAWQRILQLARGRRTMTPLERRAAEALAIHHEHRARDLGVAQQYAETLHGHVSGRLAEAARHRLSRLSRKITAAEKTTGGQAAAPLLSDID